MKKQKIKQNQNKKLILLTSFPLHVVNKLKCQKILKNEEV